MFKKLIIATTMLTMFPTVALAAQTDPVTYPTPNYEILPFPQPQHYSVTPSNPLHLEGCRGEKASGKGFVSFVDYHGDVMIVGKGRVGIREEDGTKWKKYGFKLVHRLGDWTIFQGQGSFSTEGSSLDLTFLGKGELKARGCGISNYRGWWEVEVWQRWVWPTPPPDPYPIPLPIEFTNLIGK